MASPFRIFRKYQKTLLVVAGVILIIVFVLSDSLPYLTGARSGGGGGSADAGNVAVTWDGGSLTNRELNDLVVQRRVLNSFLENVEMLGGQAAYRAGVEPRQLRVQVLRGPDTPQQGVEQSVVNTRIFADAAREAGMRVSNESIKQYLNELGRGNVTSDDMRAILNRRQSSGWQVSIEYVLDALREEMLAKNFVNSHHFAFVTITPEQRWKDWLRVNDHIVLEAAAIPIEKFEVDVPKPTDAELVAFFDKYKSAEASPVMYYNTELPSATPGFAIPRKIDVQYIAANYDDFVKKVEGEITDAEIAKYYDENKDPLFIKADTKLSDDKPDAAGPATESAKNGAASENKPAEEPSPPKTESAPAGEPGASPESQPATDAAKPESEPPAPEGEKQQPAEEGKPAPADGKQSSLERTSRSRLFRLAAFQEKAEEKDSAATEATSPADAGAEATTDAKEPAVTTEPAADSAPPPPASSTAPPAASATEPSTATPPPTDASAAPAAPPLAAEKNEKPKEYQPLDEVRDQIRHQLAIARVAEDLTKLIGDLEGEVSGEFTKYFSEVLTAQADEKKPPAPPASLADLAPLAEKHGLTAGKTGPMSLLQMRDTPVGKSGVAESGNSLLAVLFGSHELELYQPIATVDVDGNRYIAMKTSDTKGRVPELADVRDEVVKAWTRMKAAELAEKHAEEIAKKVQESKSSLTDYFADDPSVKVVRTDPFTELTGGDVGLVGGRVQRQPYRLSEPDGVVAAGPDFMKKAFDMKDGEVAAVLNNDHSMAYVIRVVEHEPTTADLRTAYLGEANSWPGQYALASTHAQEVGQSFVSDIIGKSGLKWEGNHPDKIEQEKSGGEKQEGG